MSASIFQKLLIAPLPYVPREIVWRLSQRYIAGTDLESAYRTIRELNASGCKATVDVLGEDSTTLEQVDEAHALYVEAIDGIAEHELDCNVSVKLSEMGLRFDKERCLRVMQALAEQARSENNFVRIDMEDSSVTTDTLAIYNRLRERCNNVGVVLQSCLHRTEQDVHDLLAGGPTNVRLCKGIYIEPADIAYTSPHDIRQSFCELLEILFENGAERVAIATHDQKIIEFADMLIERMKLSRDRYEFQMLLGVAERTRDRLVAAGHPLRVYVPFGEQWYAYSMRRLRENPRIAGHVFRAMFGRS